MMANIHKDYVIVDDVVAEMKPDVVISFLSDKILRGKILELPNINFHPAPPKYPGRGGASYAIFNGDKEYGATAHQMTDKVDAGPIYKVRYCNVVPTWDCKTLFEVAENHCYHLLRDFVEHYSRKGMWQETSIEWNGKAKTRKDFQEFLMAGEFEYSTRMPHYGTVMRKIRACKHPDFPGPYITVGGYKFELCKGQ